MENQPSFGYEVRNGVYIYSVRSVDRHAVDELFEAAIAQNQTAIAENTHLMRIWVIEKLLFPTPYLREKLTQAAQDIPDTLRLSTGVVMLNMKALWSGVLFLRRLMPQKRMLDLEFFSTIDEALVWMEKRHRIITDHVKES